MFSVEASIEAEGKDISIFSWFGAGENGNILEDMSLHPEYSEQKILPIADTEFNDRFVLNGSNGKIQFIEYSNGSCKTIDIANSFDEFIEGIKFDKD